jgi:predicted transcriptional regulator of viral defense system
MGSLDAYLDQQLERGRAYFSREEAQQALDLAPPNLAAAVSRLIRKRRLANPRHGFYLILRPEDRALGAPDPARWIDPLMKHQGIDYRISLLRAAAFHGSTGQATMVFQVIIPKQLRDLEIGRHRLQFIYQAPHVFTAANRPEWLAQMKSEAGFAQVAGVELTLFDCARYLHRAAGINGVAQIAKDLGGKADPRKLARLAHVYENSSVRRLGYLLELSRHARQAKALEPFAREAKSLKPLDPAAKPLVAALASSQEKNAKWMLLINERVEVEA